MFNLAVRGHGINYAMEIVDDKITMGPVLPYDKKSIAEFEIKNPMEFPIEIYSSDFDKKFHEEEEFIKRYEGLINPETGQNDLVLFYGLRNAGDEFWSQIKQSDEK